jgi:hypothetical protein
VLGSERSLIEALQQATSEMHRWLMQDMVYPNAALRSHGPGSNTKWPTSSIRVHDGGEGA